jgi:acetyl esterase
MSCEKEPVDSDDLESGIRRFQAMTTADYGRLTPPGIIDIVNRRKIAEAVRQPWARGGPEMAETIDLRVGHHGVGVRLHRPVAEFQLPALIYVHGGGWMLFSIASHDRLMREYAARARVTVIGVDYSLAPEARFPIPIYELIEVVGWVRSPAGQKLLNPSSLAIGGDSAGANLAIATNLALRGAGQPLLDAMLLNYGAFDVTRRESHDRYGGSEYTLTSTEMDEFWSAYLPEDRWLDPLARPLLADLSGLPPTFLCVAECDILADENRAMAQRLHEAGVAVTLNSYAGATHSFLEAISVSSLADRALDDASAWLSGVLRASSTRKGEAHEPIRSLD